MAAGDIIVVNENSFGQKGNYFDGVDDYVLHDAHAIARVAADDTVGTYTAWIYIDDLSVINTILSAGDNNSANEFLQFFIESGGFLKVNLVHGGTSQFRIQQGVANINKREWTHVAVVQDGVQSKLYVNGLNVSAANQAAVDLTFWYDELTLVDKFAIGVLESNNTHTNDFKGAIGQVKYFNIALTPEEILVEKQGKAHTESTDRTAAIETARVFDITMEDDGITDDGSGADNGTLTGNAHYGGYISTYSQAMENNVTGHAAEVINSFPVADRILSIIKRGD